MTGSRGREDSWQGDGWRTRVGEAMAGGAGGPNFHVDKPEGTAG